MSLVNACHLNLVNPSVLTIVFRGPYIVAQIGDIKANETACASAREISFNEWLIRAGCVNKE